MIGELLDSFIAAFSPKRGLDRVAARLDLERVRKIRERSLDGGKMNRLLKAWGAKPESGEPLNIAEVSRARYRAWDLYRNNCYAKKAVNALVAQAIGCGLKPESQATKPGGEPDSKFRTFSKELWKMWCMESCHSGKPGQGGFTFGQQLTMGFLSVILSGEVFIRLINEPNNDSRIAPFSIELIECERVPDDSVVPSGYQIPTGNYIYRGIEFNEKKERVAYHVYKYHPQDPRQTKSQLETTRIPANQMIHWFRAETDSQIRGITWLAPLLLQLKDIKDYQENEMVSAAIGACFSVAITQKSGATPFGGMATPSGEDSTDDDGNPITRIQPGMIMRFNEGESVTPIAPSRPNSAAEPFINHLLRSLAGGLPGLKSSTITMDYRASSFSSERSADNDCWRETEQVQEWIASSVCQPIWERVIDAGILSGWFDDMDFRSFKPKIQEGDVSRKTAINRRRYMAADWNGPVAKSINPTDDAQAAIMLIEANLSSLAIECANIGTNWEENIAAKKKVYDELQKQGLPVKELMEADLMQAETTASQAKAFAALNPPAQTNGTSKRNPFMGRNGEDLSSRYINGAV